MSGLGIDTRSDIYSLGVLLYELLTGKPPVDKNRLLASRYAEMMRIIREEEPLRPSRRISTLGHEATAIAHSRSTDEKKLSRSLRGELDWIVMKALEKDRERRYADDGVTSVGFSPDDRRSLSGHHDGTITLWDAVTGEEALTLRAHRHFVKLAAFSPDGRRMVSADNARTTKIWDAGTAEFITASK